MFSSAAYAVNYNARCLVPQYSTGQWLVGTCGLYDKNEVTLLAFDEESGDLEAKALYQHPDEIWALESSYSHPELMITSSRNGNGKKSSLSS